MFTRSELEIKTIRELRDLCRRYGIKPTGNPVYKVSYITSLMAFPQLALDFLHKSGKGEGGRGKGFVLSPSPLTFTLFPRVQKALLQEVYYIRCKKGEG